MPDSGDQGVEVTKAESEKLSGRVVVVTGAASGIGEAAARQCVSQGAQVLLVDRDFERLEALGKSIGSPAMTFAGDVGESDTASRYVAAALDRFGRLDTALLNAGIAGKIGPLECVSSEDFDHIMRVNVRSVWSAMAALFPIMKNADGGSIVVTASTGGVLGAPFVAPYIASKHAVIGLVKSAALEGARYRIRVNAVAPAPIDTPMMNEINNALGSDDTELSRKRTLAHVPMRRYGTASEVAKMLVFIASDDAGFATGGVYLLDGGLSAGIFP